MRVCICMSVYVFMYTGSSFLFTASPSSLNEPISQAELKPGRSAFKLSSGLLLVLLAVGLCVENVYLSI